MLKRRLAGDRYVLAPGQVVRGEQEYRIGAHLGGGAFSAAYRAVDEAGRDCFLKEYLPAQHPRERPEILRMFRQECDVMRRLGSYELCPRLWDAFQNCGLYYLVQDFIPGRDLDTLLDARTQLDEETLVRWSLSLTHALAFLHTRQVVHHDLKPANVRMNADDDPVLLDFGAARWYRTADEKSEILYGTEGYLAPEYSGQLAEDLPAGMRMDVFALGRVLVEMMVGERLSQADIDRRHDQIYGSILHSKTLDIGFVKAIFRSVSYDPKLRYPNAIEMEKDLAQSAAPVARRRPARVDLGLAKDVRPREAVIQVYNVGGGLLAGEVSTDVEWLEVGVSGAGTARGQTFEANRQSVRAVALTERLPPGASGKGRVIISTASGYLESAVTLRRAADVTQVSAQPARLKLTGGAGEEARATLTIRNRGGVPVAVELLPPEALPITSIPATFALPAGGQVEVAVAIAGQALPAEPTNAELAWTVEGVEKPPIPLELRARGGASGLLGAMTRGKRRGG